MMHGTTNIKVKIKFPFKTVYFLAVKGLISCRTMALGLTQPLTEMSTRNISWG